VIDVGTAAGSVFVVGTSYFDAYSEYVTIAYDASTGSSAWKRRLGAEVANVPQWLQPVDSVVDAAGNVYVTGGTPMSGPDAQVWTVKYAPDGTQAWATQSLGTARKVAVDSAGDVFVGIDRPAPGRSPDMIVAKYSSAGELLWEAASDGIGAGGGLVDIAPDGLGGAYTTGSYVGADYSHGWVTTRYGASGSMQWQARDPGGLLGNPAALAVDANGNAFVTGFTTVRYGPYGNHLLTSVRYGPTGTTEWVVRLYDCDGAVVSCTGNYFGKALWTDGTGALTVSGTGDEYAGFNGEVTARIGASGDVLWIAKEPGTNFVGVAQGDAGVSYHLASSPTSPTALRVFALDAAGRMMGSSSYDVAGAGYTILRPRSIAVDRASGSVFVVAVAEKSKTSADYFTAKFIFP